MKVARKLLVTGAASLVLAGGIVALPSALPVNATHGGHGWYSGEHTDNSFVLKEDSNATYSIKTEVSPDRHKVWSTVTNKTTAALTPNVTFNGEQAAGRSGGSLDPGESKRYYYYFTGNNFNLDVVVTADGVDPFTSSAVVNLQEPVSFQTTSIDNTNKTITGTLTNNTADPQTVYLKTHKKNKVTATLAANETRSVTVSSASYRDKHHDNKLVRINVATEGGYHSSYSVFTGYKATEPVPLDS